MPCYKIHICGRIALTEKKTISVYNIFDKKIIIREHREDFYLIILSLFLILLVYLNDYSGLNIIISVLSSLSNSGLSLISSDNNLSLYFILITAVGGSLISNTSGIKFTRIYILKLDIFQLIYALLCSIL